mmetsp:Transcript_13949/g.25747  ORF Transcript_13949/g.25747 Transcript_13949/m.25747 type:complete len:217 (-) Transcript_13949:351-1001(-)
MVLSLTAISSVLSRSCLRSLTMLTCSTRRTPLDSNCCCILSTSALDVCSCASAALRSPSRVSRWTSPRCFLEHRSSRATDSCIFKISHSCCSSLTCCKASARSLLRLAVSLSTASLCDCSCRSASLFPRGTAGGVFRCTSLRVSRISRTLSQPLSPSLWTALCKVRYRSTSSQSSTAVARPPLLGVLLPALEAVVVDMLPTAHCEGGGVSDAAVVV